jgi:hypothetical protein
MFVVVIRDGPAPSLKSNFVINLFSLRSESEFFFVSRNDKNKFTENWCKNRVELATSFSGILVYFFIMRLLKSPKDLHDVAINRITKKKTTSESRGFATILSQALYQYLARSGRTDCLIGFLGQIDKPKIFLVDEFFSINSVKIEKLKNLGQIIYVSSDLASDFYGDNYIASKLMYKLEKHAIALPDLVVVCSERDRIKYIQMGAKKTLFYPNIYPTEFELSDKDISPSLAVVLRGHWGSTATESLEKVLAAIACIDRPIKVYMIGVNPKKTAKNIHLEHYNYIPSREEYLKTLSKSWIGINLGIHAGGSNQRKYDYALAGLAVFSDTFGARGDLLSNEHTYVDEADLAAKLKQLLNLGRERIIEMGQQNRNQALSLAKEKQDELIKIINRM